MATFDATSENCVFLTNISYSATSDELQTFLNSLLDSDNVVSSIVLFKSNDRPNGRGLAFVDSEEAIKSLTTIETVQFDGREMSIKPYNRPARTDRTERATPVTVQIRNFNYRATFEEISEHLNTNMVFQVFNSKGQFNGECFINFPSVQSAIHFCKEMNDTTFMGRNLLVNLKDDTRKRTRDNFDAANSRNTFQKTLYERPQSPEGPPPGSPSS
jgi:RNA recognition motif-containing protein